MPTTDAVAALRFRDRSSAALPYALVGVSFIGLWFAIIDHVWTDPGSLAIGVIFITAVLGFALWLKLINDRMAILVTADAFVLRGVRNEIITLANRAAVNQIVLRAQSLQLLDAHGRELYKTERSAWSDQQVEAFGKAVGVPVIRV
ncbi:MAG TPA: hypothetical protein VHK65_13825 [Candidatus Dormibacteraeota bacterium]|nr:hypothetical protein [Candidatus Dormibacteraeota bacterium]